MSKEPHTDVTRVIPEFARIRERTAALDYAGLSAEMLAVYDRDERLLADAGAVAAEEPALADLVAERARSQPDDILAKALQAHGLIVRGWAVRSHLAAEHVASEQFEQFFSHLREAELTLIELCAVEPAWTYPWYLRLFTGRGLELGLSEIRRRYDRLAEIDPQHYPGQWQLLQRLCPKWGGDWEEAFGFARACAGAASAGSPAHAIIAQVHLEKWVSLDTREQVPYLRRPGVLEEVRAAARASVFHDAFDPGFSWVRLHTLFGALLALAGDQNGAARHFAVLGDVVDAGVWGYLGASRQVVQRAREASLGVVGVR